jgi:16S rRNA C967 or C1407 C5-methylase (RsmB/RsmF family)
MNFETLLNITTEIIEKLDSKPNISTKSINLEISLKKFLGSKDRKVISNLAFAYYKYNISINFVTEYSSNDTFYINLKVFNLLLLIQHPICSKQYNDLIQLIKSFCKISDINIALDEWLIKKANIEQKDCIIIRNNFIDRVTSIINKDDYESISKLYSYNEVFLNNISEVLKSNLKKELLALNYEASTDIRLNSRKHSMSQTKNELNSNNINFTEAQYSPICIKLNKRYNLDSFDFYKNGQIEIQDEGSQLICYGLNPNANSLILDACAGAGGKSLLLAYLTSDSSKIISSDLTLDRMKELEKRKVKASFKSIECKIINDSNLKDFENKFDFVLIDAPCTGSGTVRRDPFLKYSIDSTSIKEKSELQLELLLKYSKTVKIGGIVVYATCSVFNLENEDVIAKFLKSNTNFIGDNLKKSFLENNISLNIDDDQFSIYFTPHLNKTDGFYLARLKRIC